MAARGARSRKGVEKQIAKETTKHDPKGLYGTVMSPAPSVNSSSRNVTSPVAGWGRKTSLVSSASSTHSGDSRDSGSKHSGGTSIGARLAGVADDKFVSKVGRETSAPRG